MITDDMFFGAGVGWELAHDEICPQGPVCSAHQPISAEAQRGRLTAALVSAVLEAHPDMVLSAELTRGVIESLADDVSQAGRAGWEKLEEEEDSDG